MKELIKKVINNPSRVPHYIYPYIDKIINLSNYRKSKSIADEPWNYLIILDACRYDAFKYINYLEGELKYIYSKGSSTPEFLEKNFLDKNRNKKFKNIVYITANPFVNKMLKNMFHKIYPIWKYGWNEEHNTVLPKTVYKESLKIINKHRNKRIIIHFMQPHHPFLIANKEFNTTGFRENRKAVINNKSKGKDITWADLLSKGEIKQDMVIKYYLINLKIVLLWVNLLINSLNGRIIITSDHGNLFGEISHPLFHYRIYGHPSHFHIDTLVKVPWFIVDTSNKVID